MRTSAPGQMTRVPSIPETAPRSASVRVARRVVPLAFVALMVAAAADLVVSHLGRHGQSVAGPTVPKIPVGPALRSLPQAGAPVPALTAAQQVTSTVRTFAALARALPTGTLTLGVAGWQLHRPVAIAAGGRLIIEHRRLALAPGAFIEATTGGSVYLGHTRVVSVGTAGRPDAVPTARRGFLLAVGGRLQLVHDRLQDLGHVADGAAGITFRNVAPGSRVAESVVTGGYTGVEITESVGVRVVRDRFVGIAADAIAVESHSHDITLAADRIAGVGDHGVLVSGTSHQIRILRNHIADCRRYAVELYNRATAVRVAGNTITRSFDGIVLTAASEDVLTGNQLGDVRRYGFRVSTGSHQDVLRSNRVSHTPVGVYVYGNAHNVQILGNRFAQDQLDVRVRHDSSNNIINPVPANSIIGR